MDSTILSLSLNQGIPLNEPITKFFFPPDTAAKWQKIVFTATSPDQLPDQIKLELKSRSGSRITNDVAKPEHDLHQRHYIRTAQDIYEFLTVYVATTSTPGQLPGVTLKVTSEI